MITFNKEIQNLRTETDQAVQSYISGLKNGRKESGVAELVEAMAYSLTTGGARIRPSLGILTAKALSQDPKITLALGCAIELIHTYSLIHDDLPAMDDDDFRRGQPSSHKKFGEGLAILAGDAMSTEAFLVLARAYSDDSALALDLVQGLAQAAGPDGMAGGQAIDLVLRNQKLGKAEIKNLHQRKTGKLLEFSVMGAARICNATPEQLNCLGEYSKRMGLVFQIADDLMDGTQTDELSFVTTAGLDETRKTCETLVAEACQALDPLGAPARGLKDMVTFIYERTKS